MSKQEVTSPVNLKAQNATHSFRLTIRDKEHFYRIVKWLNENVGKGSDKWTMEGKVLRRLTRGATVSPLVYIFKQDFDTSSALFLNLI